MDPANKRVRAPSIPSLVEPEAVKKYKVTMAPISRIPESGTLIMATNLAMDFSEKRYILPQERGPATERFLSTHQSASKVVMIENLP